MAITMKIEITRSGRRIGSVEVPRLPEGEASLPLLEGNERGLAVVVEMEGAPTAALIFPWKGESIDIADPVRWEVPVERLESLQRRNLLESPSMFHLRGKVRPSALEGEQRFSFDFTSRETSEGREFPFRLEIRDEGEYGFLRWDFAGEPRSGRARIHGSFRSTTEEGGVEADMFFDFRGWHRGFGEGHFRGQMRSRGGPEPGRGEFRFMVHAFGSGHGYAEGHFEGGDLSSFPLLWLMERVFKRAQAADGPIQFEIWVGAMRYSSESREVLARRDAVKWMREISGRLDSAESLSETDFSKIANQFSSILQRIRPVELQYSQSPALLLQRESPTTTPRLRTDFAFRDLSLQFDVSVSPEKRIDFLVALADELSNSGGRLCFAQQSRIGHE